MRLNSLSKRLPKSAISFPIFSLLFFRSQFYSGKLEMETQNPLLSVDYRRYR
jgi:hypothetical protein